MEKKPPIPPSKYELSLNKRIQINHTQDVSSPNLIRNYNYTDTLNNLLKPNNNETANANIDKNEEEATILAFRISNSCNTCGLFGHKNKNNIKCLKNPKNNSHITNPNQNKRLREDTITTQKVIIF